MTNSDKVAMLTAMTGETATTTLNTYLTLAGDKVCRKAYPFNPEERTVPPQYDMVQVEIAAYMLNKRGAEGEIKHNENGINREYESGDIPFTLLRDIVPFVGGIANADAEEE